MKISRLMVAALAVPIVMQAQVAPPATAAARGALERMQANVANIKAPTEKKRWSANVAMWKIVLAKPGPLSAANVDALKASLSAIRTNVAPVVRSDEKERWLANIRLWEVFLRDGRAMAADAMPMMPPGSMSGMPCCAGGAKMGGGDAAFGRMMLNVGQISEAGEKERWQANCELWQAILAPQP